MSSSAVTESTVAVPGLGENTLSGVRAAVWLVGAMLFGLALYYFIGVDQGLVSVFGKNLYIHEFVHDGRHLLGFPCH